MPMTVKAILSHKGNDVVTIKPTATLCDAAEILNEHGIGAVVIEDEGHPRCTGQPYEQRKVSRPEAA
jgi:CBS domain-containing protein